MPELHELTARELIRALDEGTLTSLELTQYYLDRIKTLNTPLNAVVWHDEEAVIAAAREADLKRKRGEPAGPLGGLPMTLKDCFEVKGMPTTAGSPRLKDHFPARDSDVAERLRASGAIIVGHTNVPLWASDLQSDNRVYGRSNNPWNLDRTPGGSSGGAAAALAAGLTPLEVGSDIGGSIRTPSGFCGVIGHKPTHGLISLRGHVPGPPGILSPPDLAVAGPMARNADDLEMLFDLLIGPPEHDKNTWTANPAACDLKELRDFRVGAWFKDPACPVDDEVDQVYQTLLQTLSRERCPWQYHSPLNLEEILPVYFNLLGSVIGATLPPGEKLQMRLLAWLSRLIRLPNLSLGMEEFARAANQSHARWMGWNEQRYQIMEEVEQFFEHVDVVLCPVTPVAAFPHQTHLPFPKRTLEVNGQRRPYSDLMTWISVATTLGLPATSAPVGFTAEGLPVNVQIIGARGRDRQTIHFARLLEQSGMAFHFPNPTMI